MTVDFASVEGGVIDARPVFMEALAAIDARKSKRNPAERIGGHLDVPNGEYFLSAPLPLHRFTTIDLHGSTLWCAGGAFIVDSGYIQSEQSIYVRDGLCRGLGVPVFDENGVRASPPTTGVHFQGGVDCLFENIIWTGFDHDVVFTASNRCTVRGGGMSWRPGEGVRGCGVKFDFYGSGGTCNANVVEQLQMNGKTQAVQLDDSAASAVRNVTFNGCEEVLRVTGCISFSMTDCMAEGTSGPTYIRFGQPGGSPTERIVAQNLVLTGNNWSRNEPHVPSIIRFEQNTQVWEVDLGGTLVFANPHSPLIACAEPWPTIPAVKIRHLSRKGLAVEGVTVIGWRNYGQWGGPVMSDRDLNGTDYGA